MDYCVRLFSLTGKFQIVATLKYDTLGEARKRIEHHARVSQFSNVKFVNDEDFTIRVTATTPNGRQGRNIGCIEPGDDSWI